MKINYLEKIYYINLTKDIQKNNFFLKQIEKSILHNQCERLVGVDGSSVDLRILPSNIITDRAIDDILLESQRVYGVTLTYGALGCALSHKLIYEECAKKTHPFLVLEDDIILCENFDTKLLELINKIKNINYDICYIGYNEIPGFKKQQIDDVVSKPSGLITGTYGYFLTPHGAQKLLKIIFPLNVQIDSSISNNINHFNIYCSTTKLINYTNKFGSKTQQDNSCKNIYRSSSPYKNNWDSLFDE